MSDPKNDLSGWAESLGNGDAPVEGLDKDTLRRAMQLNPQLKAQLGGTNKVVAQLEKAAQDRPAPGAEKVERRPQAANLAEGVKQTRERYQAEIRRLQEQLAKTQRDIAALKPQTLEKIIDLVIDADPNMSAVYTQEILKMEQSFFTEVGFTVRKVIDRQLKVRR